MKNSLFLGTRFKKSKFRDDLKLKVKHYLTEKWNFHIDFRCDALELENGNFADLVGEAEAQKVIIFIMLYLQLSLQIVTIIVPPIHQVLLGVGISVVRWFDTVAN